MKSKGFSLMELIIVMIFISFSMALVAPSLSRIAKTIELKTTAKRVSGILRYYRSEAVNKGRVYQILFNSDSRQVEVRLVGEDQEGKERDERDPKKTYSLPDGIQIGEIDIPSPQYFSDLPAIEFYPNGGSNGGTLLLKGQDHNGFKVKVHFLTGTVKVEKVEGI